jgi:hypothetical protein
MPRFTGVSAILFAGRRRLPMMRWNRSILSVLAVIGLVHAGFGGVPAGGAGSAPAGQRTIAPAEKLVVLWTSGDRDVAMNMVFMYTLNAKLAGWWPDVTFIVWGPSAKLLSEDAELQAELGKMKIAGIVLEACIACSDRYGVTGKLRELGIDVKGMGKPLTAYIKEGRRVLTF